jgi:hypothetical protein
MSSSLLLFRYLLKKDTWNFLSKIDILLVDHDGHRSYDFEGRKYAPLIDSFQDSFDSSKVKFLTVAEPYSKIIGAKAYGYVIDFNGSFARASVYRQFRLLFKKEKYPGQFGYTNVWNTILEKTKPKLIISIMPSESLCFAAHTHGILIADLQHGIIADKHPWYGQSFKENMIKKCLPDYYLCWNQESADVLLKWTVNKAIQVRVIGNPWFIKYRQSQGTDFFQRNIKESTFKRSNNLPTILITLGWGFMHYNTEYLSKQYAKQITFEQEAGFSIALLNVICEYHAKFNWKIRLHPVQLNGAEFKIIDAFLFKNFNDFQNVDWIECSKLPLPFVLENIDLHITFCSTIVSEATLFGVRSAILVPYPTPADWLESYFQSDIKNGFANFIFNEHEEILNWITSNLNMRKEYSNVQDNDYYEFINDVTTLLN